MKYQFELVKDEKYGNYNDTAKKWNGMVGEILRDVSVVHIVFPCIDTFIFVLASCKQLECEDLWKNHYL